MLKRIATVALVVLAFWIQLVAAAPVVTLTAPANNASYLPPAAIKLTATATDTSSTITKVEFYNGSTLIGTATAQPYEFTWTNVTTGTYSISAKATSKAKKSTTSASKTIIVNKLPTITLSAPVANSSFNSPATIALSSAAIDTDGTISKVEFYNGTTLLSTATTAPYSYSWVNVGVGSYTLTAKATDNLGGAATSTAVSVQVINPAPGVSITSPANNSNFVTLSTIGLAADASDSNGTIANVAFYRDTTLIGTATTAPYNVSWTNPAAGTYSLTAKATDNGGAVTTSAPVTITVADNKAPTVAVTATPTNATAPATITLTAVASDTDGTIAKVEFFNGASSLGVVTQAPFTYSWSGVTAGSYSVTAKATDNLGAATVSSTAAVTIAAPIGNADIDYAKVAVLLHLDESIVDRSATPISFVDHGAPRTYSTTNKKFGSASLVNGPGQYLDVPTFAALNDYTIEMWMYPTAYVGGAYGGALVRADHGADYFNVAFAQGGSQGISYAFGQSVTAPAIPLNAWIHVAVVRKGNVGTIYYNGQNVWTGSVGTGSYPCHLELFGAHDLTSFVGNIDEFRISSLARYSANFTPPSGASYQAGARIISPMANQTWNAPTTLTLTAEAIDPNYPISNVEFFNGATSLGVSTNSPFSLNWTINQPGSYSLTAKATDNLGGVTVSNAVTGTVISPMADPDPSGEKMPVLLHLDESLVNSSSTPLTFVDHGAARTYSTTNKKFGSASLVNGPGQYLDVPTFAALNDYTIEMWLYPTAYVGGAYGGALVRAAYGSDYLNVALAQGSSKGISYAFGQSVTAPAIPLNVWIHVAIVRQGSVGTIYYNGQNVWTGSVSTGSYPCNLELFGAHDLTSFLGNVDDFRISAVARYNANFPIPTAPSFLPGVRVTSSAANRAWNGPATIPLTATAIDPNYPISQIEFFNGSTSLGIVTQPPYVLNWNNVGFGDYVVTAKSSDFAQFVSTSGPLTINVKANVAPTVSVTQPIGNTQFISPANITLNANASDSNGTIASVSYYQDATLIGTATTAPYTVNWSNVMPGNYSITAKATDNDAGIGTSTVVPVVVIYNAAPTVSVSATQTNASTPATIALTANAADVDGNVAQVEFFYNGVNKLGAVTQAPYSYNWSGVGTGVYSVTAKATDNLGTATTSAAVSVNVGAVAAGAGTIYYIHSDQINTPRMITDAANQTVWQWDSDPFGTALPNENPGNLGNFTFNPRFPGQYFDKETGLHYNYFRDYDPQTGRYVQSDPIGLTGGLNTYAYVGENPLSSFDPLGLYLTKQQLDEIIRNAPDLQNIDNYRDHEFTSIKDRLPKINDACVRKYLEEHYPGLFKNVVDFGNMQQYDPASNPNFNEAAKTGIEVGTEKFIAVEGLGKVGSDLMKSYPGSLSLGNGVGSVMSNISKFATKWAGVAGAGVSIFGTTAMALAREACACKE